MEYELAKELMDLGFLYNSERYCGQCESSLVFHPEDDGLAEYNPTLSELITACGESFHALKVYHRPEVEWIAMAKESFYIPGQITGKTPEEAVARLWIALNTKA
jgi:hypothetical protein